MMDDFSLSLGFLLLEAFAALNARNAGLDYIPAALSLSAFHRFRFLFSRFDIYETSHDIIMLLFLPLSGVCSCRSMQTFLFFFNDISLGVSSSYRHGGL